MISQKNSLVAKTRLLASFLCFEADYLQYSIATIFHFLRVCKTQLKLSTHISRHIFVLNYSGFPYGLAVRIPGFHPGGPGSTPGMGTVPFLLLLSALYFEEHVLI